METIREQLQIFVRRFGLLNAACCDECCGEQVSMVQSHILFEVRRMTAPSMQQVAEELGMDITTFSRQVKTLEGKRLLMKQVSSDDRRVSLLSLTVDGTRVLEQIDRFMSVKLEQLFSTMTPFERDSVSRSFVLLNEAVTKVGSTDASLTKIACCK